VDDQRLPTSLTMSDDGTRAALEEILPLVRDPQLTPTPQQLLRQDAVTRFENGRLGMLFGTRELVPRLRQAEGLSFDVFPLPSLGRYRTVADMTGYCISAASPHIEAAADFLAFATGPEGAEITAASGAMVPVNLPVLHSDAFTQPGQQPENVEVFAEAVRRTTLMPFVPEWPLVVRRTQPIVDRLFYDPVLNLDRLLPRIDARSQAILAPAEEPTD
jgi:multiple sugar transport system substrate-binding protein